jgi:hypothetical protein
MQTVAGEDKIMHISMATIYSLSIVVGVDVAVSNMEVFNAATGLQQRVRIALLSSYKYFVLLLTIYH